ncbi:MAG: winged helix-turn-helix transcriptional regulator [Alcanivoracaceae bacterium]|nr:winged helix-turn-helix transcriptional regulator [Alcanivoracaceae bacterium]
MHYLFYHFILDTNKKELYIEDKLVPLTKQNYNLLLFFIQNTNTVIDRERLLENVWVGKVVNTNTIDQAIVMLKKKITSSTSPRLF